MKRIGAAASFIDIYIEEKSPKTMLKNACVMSDTRKVRKALRDLPNLPSSYYITYASYYGNLNIIKILVSNGVEITCNNIVSACGHGFLSVVKFLVANKGDININAKAERETALTSACMFGNIGIVKFLVIECGAIVDDAAIENATKSGHRRVVRFLTSRIS